MEATTSRAARHHGRIIRRALAAVSIIASAIGASFGTLAPAAHADGPGTGTPWVVTLGDSYISGEAGRWAGNTNTSSSNIDALGPTAYYDNATNTGETIAGCHRSKSDEAYIGDGVNGLDLACSGAKTSTATGGDFKPGIDFYDDGAGHQGQAKMLQSFAASHNVRLVVLSIGGNNFNFASIVQSCVSDFLFSPSWWKDYCYDDSSVKSNFTSGNVATQTAAIKGAIENVRTALHGAGYGDSQFTILVQDYPSPIPYGSAFRYSESGYTRQSTGGCGFWNKDADWANNSALVTINGAVKNAAAQTGAPNVQILEVQSAFNGRRLCENTAGLLEEKGLATWRSAGAVDKTEWINQIRTVTTIWSDYQIQESIHPNYWGQLALRNCVRQAFNGGSPHGGTCTIAASGLNGHGEPNMALR